MGLHGQRAGDPRRGTGVLGLNAAELATHPVEEQIDAYGAAGTTLLRYEPLGVVSILTPWNFPHTLNVMKVCAALAAGNTVVLKPSPLAPLAGLALARIIDEHTDIPPGVVNVVTPTDIESSKLLTVDPRIDMVSFTGSSAVGREVMAAAGGTMKRLLLECGGKSASIVLDDWTLRRYPTRLLERMLFESCSFHAGQACILHSRLLLPESIHDEVVDRLVALARAVKVGDPTDPEVQMGPLISAAQLRTRSGTRGSGSRRRRQAGDRRGPAGRLGWRLLLRADDPDRGHAGCDHRAGRGVRTGVVGAAL